MALDKNENFFELTDENDRASAIEAQFNEDALENARRKTLPETNPDKVENLIRFYREY